MQELTDQATLVNDAQDIETLEKLHFAKGQLNVIGKFLNFEETLKRAETAIEEEAEDDDEGIE